MVGKKTEFNFQDIDLIVYDFDGVMTDNRVIVFQDGVEAVIDKDLASERLAEQINAELLFILTNVEKVYLNYNTPEEKPIDEIKLEEIEKYYQEGQFPPGSMGPKILAAILFLNSGGKKVIISHVDKGIDAFKGETGTHITK